MIDKARLLIIDADPVSRQEHAAVLRGMGWEVGIFDSVDADPQDVSRNLDLDAFSLAVAVGAHDKPLQDLRQKDGQLPILQIVEKGAAPAPVADAVLVRPVETGELARLSRTLAGLREARRAARESETWLQLAQEVGGLAVMEVGLLNRRIRWSPKFAEIFQLSAEAKPADIKTRVHPEDLPGLLTEYESYLRTGELLERDFRLVRLDGSIRWISARGKLIKDVFGRSERILFLCSDITERKESELQNAQLAAIVASSIDAIVSIDFNDHILTWNHGAERLFGYTADEVIGTLATVLVPPDLLVEREAVMKRLSSGEAIEYHTMRYRKDGQLMNVWIRGAPVRSANGRLAGGSLIIRDVTAQHQHEEHVRFLMRELTHRSKNLLAVIQAMARQTLSHQTTPEDFVARFSERLSGLAGSHDLLLSDDWSGASLVKLIRSQLQHYSDLFDSRIFLIGTDLFLRPEAAQNIGIALHELSTNAAKFGALSVSEGTITLSWALVDDEQGERRLDLLWEEKGGPPVAPPNHKGFGHMVMERITGPALGGKSHMQFAPEGARWHLNVPVKGVITSKDDKTI